MVGIELLTICHITKYDSRNLCLVHFLNVEEKGDFENSDLWVYPITKYHDHWSDVQATENYYRAEAESNFKHVS